ncbi:MAG: hypothetical protein ACK4J0_01810 [Candidatus Anstonellaceae archaeon]
MSDTENFIRRSLYGRVEKSSSKTQANKAVVAPKVGRIKHGKRVVYVTPYLNSAKEEEKKWQDKGLKTEIAKEKDENSRTVFVVYVFE